ncbi:MAG TPA: CvpA family protein [Gammaproteobacteria bacterium]|jgi:membrane protein required for colicin V production|nr:CvpA family protein [Gammaproteobacteria bacterium]
MTAVDYAILAILFVSAILGLARGFLREVASLVIWMLGFWLAVRFAPPIGDAFHFVKSAEDRLIIGYAVVLLATLIASTVVGMLLKKLVESSGAGVGDRSLGTLFGAARGLVIVTTLILVGELALVPQPSWWRESRLIPYAAPIVKVARRLMPVHPDFRPLQQAPAIPDSV